MRDDFLLSEEKIIDTYNRYADMVYRVCFLMLKNEPEAQDITQNVFIKFIDNKKGFESDEHLKAWFIVTAKNECKNMLRHWWKTKRVSLDSVKAYSENQDMDKGLEPFVMKLDEKYRLPVYLYYYEGYSTAEVARMLNINHSTLRTNLAKARKQLKTLLEEQEYE